MYARIYRPARTAMSSGTAKTRDWVLDYAPNSARELDPLLGGTSSDDTQSQVQIRFDTKESAISFAKDRGIEVVILDPHERKKNIRPRGYGENFATDRKVVWTH